MVQQLNAENFESTLKNNNLVIVDFYAVWCGPCKMMHPIYEELANTYKNITFAKLDIDTYSSVAIKCNVQVVPTFIAFKNGEEVGRIIGYNSKQDFEYFIKTL